MMPDGWHQVNNPVYGAARQIVADAIGKHLIERGVDRELALGLLDAWNTYTCRPWLAAEELHDVLR